MITSNLFYELIDLKSALKDIELFKVKVDINSKSIIQHQLERIETNPDVQGRFMISKYIANQLLVLTPHVIYPGRVSGLKWRLTDSFITAGQPRIIPAIVGNYHFKNDFITDYFDSISDITVSVFPSVSPSATRDKLLVGVTATLYVKKIESDSVESVDVGFINRGEVDVDENLVSMDTSPTTINYYNICFNGLTEHDQILRKKIIDELTKFI
jgi:hypothetical protein